MPDPGPIERLSRTPEFDRYQSAVRDTINAERIRLFQEAEAFSIAGDLTKAHVSLVRAGAVKATALRLDTLLKDLISREQGTSTLPTPGNFSPGNEPGYSGI